MIWKNKETFMQDKMDLIIDVLIGIGALLMGAIARVLWINIFSKSFNDQNSLNFVNIKDVKNHKIFKEIITFEKHYVLFVGIENPYKKYLAIKIMKYTLKNLHDVLETIITQDIEKMSKDEFLNLIRKEFLKKQIADFEILNKIPINEKIRNKIEEYLVLNNMKYEEIIETIFSSKLYANNMQRLHALLDMLASSIENKLLLLIVKNFFELLNGEIEKSFKENEKLYDEFIKTEKKENN